MPQKQIGSISEIELWQAGILQFKMTWKLNDEILIYLKPLTLNHFLPTN